MRIYIKVFKVFLPWSKKMTLWSCQYLEKVKSSLNFFFPNTIQWTGSIHLSHKYQRICHRKLVHKIHTINYGHYRTLTKCSIDPLVALWAFHHRTVSMVSWRKKLHQVNTADLYAYLESLTAKLLRNYWKIMRSFMMYGQT